MTRKTALQPLFDRIKEYIYYPASFYPLALLEPDKQIYYYFCDPNGTPVRLLDTKGQIVWSHQMGVWGEAGSITGTIENNLRFQGQYFDIESGLHYNRFRYYDPITASYISQDPIGLAGGLNVHAYVHNPMGWVDPLGLVKEPKRVYERALYHTTVDTKVKSRAPTNGQIALDNSVLVKSENPRRRISVDVSTDEIVVLDREREIFDKVTGNKVEKEIYHGHVRSWDSLNQEQRNALINSGKTTRKGKIIKCPKGR